MMRIGFKCLLAAVVGCVAFAANDARASFDAVFNNVTPNGSNFDFNYTLDFSAALPGEEIGAMPGPSFVTIYDLGPASSVVGITAPAGFSFTTQLLGINGFNTNPTDSPTSLNVTFTYNGPVVSSSTSFPGAVVTSIYGGMRLGAYWARPRRPTRSAAPAACPRATTPSRSFRSPSRRRWPSSAWAGRSWPAASTAAARPPGPEPPSRHSTNRINRPIGRPGDGAELRRRPSFSRRCRSKSSYNRSSGCSTWPRPVPPLAGRTGLSRFLGLSPEQSPSRATMTLHPVRFLKERVMIRFGLKCLLAAAVGCVVFAANDARASFDAVFNNITPNGSNFDFNYTIDFSAALPGEQIGAMPGPSFVTIYDLGPASSVVGITAPAGFSYTTQLLGSTGSTPTRPTARPR